jgi:hypothetical protein
MCAGVAPATCAPLCRTRFHSFAHSLSLLLCSLRAEFNSVLAVSVCDLLSSGEGQLLLERTPVELPAGARFFSLHTAQEEMCWFHLSADPTGQSVSLYTCASPLSLSGPQLPALQSSPPAAVVGESTATTTHADTGTLDRRRRRRRKKKMRRRRTKGKRARADSTVHATDNSRAPHSGASHPAPDTADVKASICASLTRRLEDGLLELARNADLVRAKQELLCGRTPSSALRQPFFSVQDTDGRGLSCARDSEATAARRAHGSTRAGDGFPHTQQQELVKLLSVNVRSGITPGTLLLDLVLRNVSARQSVQIIGALLLTDTCPTTTMAKPELRLNAGSVHGRCFQSSVFFLFFFLFFRSLFVFFKRERERERVIPASNPLTLVALC